MARRAPALLSIAVSILIALPTPASARAAWKVRIDRTIGGRSVGLSVSVEGRYLYRHGDRTKRIPASNQKLLMSMALLEELGPQARIKTVAVGARDAQIIRGNLWILGRGDPTVTGGGKYPSTLPFRPTRLGELARAIKRTGITRIEGSVAGSTGYFARDWFAPGWGADFPTEEVPLPTALTFDGNK
ncbi:MAG: D-alanyl-D-alanine carboxypeptidase, partial [Actinomycetota bacterium]|nr:D-alanyl-D-alanine carboxypeptidase [Actinomycetota bacterium]